MPILFENFQMSHFRCSWHRKFFSLIFFSPIHFWSPIHFRRVFPYTFLVDILSWFNFWLIEFLIHLQKHSDVCSCPEILLEYWILMRDEKILANGQWRFAPKEGSTKFGHLLVTQPLNKFLTVKDITITTRNLFGWGIFLLHYTLQLQRNLYPCMIFFSKSLQSRLSDIPEFLSSIKYDNTEILINVFFCILHCLESLT